MATPHPLVAAVMAAAQEQGLTLTDLHRETGYTRHSLRSWRDGHTCPDLDKFEDLAALAGLRLPDLVPADTNPAPPTEGTR